jgi:hypothetical protein
MARATYYRSNASTYGPVYPLWPATGTQAGVPLISGCVISGDITVCATLAPQVEARQATTGDEATGAWQRALARLQSFAGLTEDWDGEGSPAPTPPLVATALILADLLRQQQVPPPSRVSVGPDGSVLLEWQKRQPGQGGVVYFEIEVCAPDVAEWMQAIPGQPTQHGEFAGWCARF